MGIKKLKKAKGQREVKPPVTLYMDVSTPEEPNAKEPLRFREPLPRDMSAVVDAMRKVGDFLPGLDAETSFQVAILAVCYIKDDSDGDANTVQQFAELASDDEYLFNDVLDGFAKEFPYFFDWLKRRLVSTLPSSEPLPPTA